MKTPSELDQPIDSAESRHVRMDTMRTLLGLFGAPIAWLAQLALSEPLVAHACYPYQAPLPAPIWHGLPVLLSAVSIVCFGAALLSGFAAWTSWRRVAYESGTEAGNVRAVISARARFLITLSLMSSFIFIVAVIFNSCAVLLVPLCSSWY